MKNLFAVFTLLIISLTVSAQTKVALVMGPTERDVIMMDIRQAERLYKEFAKDTNRTENEEELLSALVVALGTRPTTFRDCSKLSQSERARIGMGSRLEISKCKVRKI